MGIAGAGNSGTLLATLFAPRLAERFGWAAMFGFAMLPLAVVFVVFALLAKDSPAPRKVTTARDYGAVLRRIRHAVAGVPLQPHVRRLRRLLELPHDVLPRAVPAVARLGGRLHDARRGGRQLPAAGRRLARRSPRRLPAAGAAARVVCRLPLRRGRGAAAARGRGGAVPRHGRAGHGQRRGVPARAAALSRIASAWSPASSARPAVSAASSCRRCWA